MSTQRPPATTPRAENHDAAERTPAFDVFDHGCPSRPVLAHLTGRWGALTMAALREGPVRFNTLRRRIGNISDKMLAQTLQSLERDGFVDRRVLAVMPHHVEYRLTALGTETAAKLYDLIEHLERHMPDVLDAQRRHAQHQTTAE
ncbi:winged helix-turn-helix transcriptional regulator [Streptomyces sp. NPDC008150]|uniref:winged helix-turn-helix transcriptional regulator n=1 Tax=Streptomyces sp. NPDC008150 TaxID=3364816 RepID=UPI0036E11C10